MTATCTRRQSGPRVGNSHLIAQLSMSESHARASRLSSRRCRMPFSLHVAELHTRYRLRCEMRHKALGLGPRSAGENEKSDEDKNKKRKRMGEVSGLGTARDQTVPGCRDLLASAEACSGGFQVVIGAKLQRAAAALPPPGSLVHLHFEH